MNAVTKLTDNRLHASSWLDRFEAALHAGDRAALASLFRTDAHWRDMLAFGWVFTSNYGAEGIANKLVAAQAVVGARGFQIAEGRTLPHREKRHGLDVIEAIFSFETEIGRCHGVLRLPVDTPDKAYVFSSSLTEIKGHEEPVGLNRPEGSAYSRNFGGANWSDLRAREQAFEDREPAVIIIGGSQFGVALAARLRALKVEALVIEKTARVGDAWRNRYHSLALHNQVAINHFPYMPFPPTWPKYLPKDMLANWIETYAWAMECNVWTSTTFLHGAYDAEEGVWNATVQRADGSERVLHPRHIVFANGVLGNKRTPRLPGLDEFQGEVMHTHDYRTGDAYRGKNVIVLGTGTSGHDTAQDLHGHGAHVSIIQRGTTNIVSVEAAGFNNKIYYEENLPIEDADLISTASTFELLKRGYQMNVVRMKEHDKALLEGLQARGFKLDFGPDDAGHQMKLRARFGGYYLNCGCSDLIANGEIDLIQWDDVDTFVAEGLRLKNGRVIPADLLITATGYDSQEQVVRELLGDEIAEKVGPIWGLDDKGELRNMFTATGQKGLWFLGGGLSQNRVYSHYTAMQILARELGLVE